MFALTDGACPLLVGHPERGLRLPGGNRSQVMPGKDIVPVFAFKIDLLKINLDTLGWVLYIGLDCRGT